MDNVTVKERLLCYLNEKKLTLAEFSRRIGRSDSFAAQLGKTALGYKDLEKIKVQFPDLSIDWLITGEGTMYGVPGTHQEPALRCTTVLGNDVVLKLHNIEEMSYNQAAQIAQIFTRFQHLIVPMSREEFEKLYQAATGLTIPQK